MPNRRLDPRRVVLISAVAASALLSYATAVPAEAAVSGTGLTASKSMYAHLVSSHAWTLSKSASPTSLTLDAGQSGSVQYTVGATRSPASLSAYVHGEICVTNEGSVPTQGLAIVDKVSKPPKKTVIASSTVDVSGNPVLAPGESHCYPYRVDLPSGVVPGATYKDTASVTITNKSGKASAPSPSTTTAMPGTAGSVDNTSLSVADTNGSTFTFNGSGTQTYTESFECPADAGTHTNTVSAPDFVSGGGISAPSPASATVTVTCPSADLSLTKVADAASVDAGSPVGFTVTVANGGSGSATGVAVSDPLPAASGVNWSIESQTGSACSVTGAVGSQELSCAVGTLGPASSYTVHVTAPTSFASCGSLPNTATVTASNAPTLTSSASVTVTCSDLDLTKTADAESVDAGSPIGFTVTAANAAAAGSATGVAINDPLPTGSGVSWSIESQTGSACSISGAVGSQVLSCTIGTLAAGASYTVHVTSPTIFASCQAYPNTATLNASNAPTQTANATTTVLCSDLDLFKIADASSVAAGSPVGFTVTAVNSGGAGTGTATGVSVFDPLPAGLDWSIDSQTGSACSVTGSVGAEVLSCTIGSLVAGESYTVHVVAPTNVSHCGTLFNTATLTATNAPTLTANASQTVVCGNDLALTKVADAASVDAGSPIGFTVTAANGVGAGSATGVSVSDPLPSGSGVNWSIESQTGSACSITGAVGSQVLTCTIGSLASGASYSVHVTSPTIFASCQAYPNTATLNATNAPTQTANATTTVLCSDLDLTKTADAASVDAGSPIGFTVTAANGAAAGTGSATGVSINDPLPSGSGVNWSIESQTGNACSISGAVGSQVLSCTIGSLASGASFTVHVTSPTIFASCQAYPNTATLNASNAPTQTANATTTVLCSDLDLFKIADASSVAAGSPVGFTVTAINSGGAGTGTATGVSVFDPLPAGLDWSIDSQTGSACSVTGSVGAEVLSCTIGSLVAGESYTVHVVAPTNVSHCGILFNTATLTASNAPTQTSNATTTVTC